VTRPAPPRAPYRNQFSLLWEGDQRFIIPERMPVPEKEKGRRLSEGGKKPNLSLKEKSNIFGPKGRRKTPHWGRKESIFRKKDSDRGGLPEGKKKGKKLLWVWDLAPKIGIPKVRRRNGFTEESTVGFQKARRRRKGKGLFGKSTDHLWANLGAGGIKQNIITHRKKETVNP